MPGSARGLSTSSLPGLTRQSISFAKTRFEPLAKRMDPRVKPAGDGSGCWRTRSRHAAPGTSARTRNGLPDPCLIFSGAAMMTAPLGGSRSQIGQALQPEPALAVHVEMGGIRRIEVLPLAEISADRLGAETVHVALLDQPLHHGGLRPRRMRAIVAQARHSPHRLRFDQSVRSNTQLPGSILPCRASHCSTKGIVSAKSGLAAHSFEQSITQAGAMNFRDVDRIDRVVGQILAGNPVDRRVEVRSGMLAETDVVPVPGRSALVVARHLLHPERRALSQLGRQHDGREFLRQRLRQVDDADVAGRRPRARTTGDRRSRTCPSALPSRARAPWD